MTILNPRDTYLAASSPPRRPSQLLVMLYERLVLDLQRAADALRAASPARPTSRCCTRRRSSSS